MNSLNNILSQTAVQNITVTNLLCVLGMSALLGLFVSGIYIFTHRRECRSSDFTVSLIMIPCIISVIILLVGNSVASAFSLAGAFSLIRFRSAPGNPKDISYIFFSVAVGLACGLGYIFYAAVFSVFLGIVMVILQSIKFGKNNNKNMILKITVPEDLNYPGLFDKVLDKYTRSWIMKKVKTREFGALFEVIFDITFNEDMPQKDFLDELRCLNGNLNIILTLSDSEPAYSE
ncbi:MAG: DUF4956 domain-containing protein [Oscillospiraceae bacterium]|nr:DUF4956 domain-containing protein [Oscillospiraceae bacterium]